MMSFAPTPIFSSAWNHRPAVPSPLSSSPIRASSPLSPLDNNALSQRQTQSSPIQPPKFKFATRPTRPNPVVRRREDAREDRRRGFLQDVRHKSADKAWQRRDIEGQFLKTSWLSDMNQLSRDAPSFTDADIDDAMAFTQETYRPEDGDDMVMDDSKQDEELDAIFASYQEEQTAQPPSPAMSDEEYDDIFAELISQEQNRQDHQQTSLSGQMDMMDESVDMPS